MATQYRTTYHVKTNRFIRITSQFHFQYNFCAFFHWIWDLMIRSIWCLTKSNGCTDNDECENICFHIFTYSSLFFGCINLLAWQTKHFNLFNDKEQQIIIYGNHGDFLDSQSFNFLRNILCWIDQRIQRLFFYVFNTLSTASTISLFQWIQLNCQWS